MLSGTWPDVLPSYIRIVSYDTRVELNPHYFVDFFQDKGLGVLN